MKNPTSQDTWTLQWLDSVKSGTYSMSQRKVSVVEKKGGGLRRVRLLAREKGIHLLRFEDDHGTDLVAASLKPFKVLC